MKKVERVEVVTVYQQVHEDTLLPHKVVGGYCISNATCERLGKGVELGCMVKEIEALVVDGEYYKRISVVAPSFEDLAEDRRVARRGGD